MKKDSRINMKFIYFPIKITKVKLREKIISFKLLELAYQKTL